MVVALRMARSSGRGQGSLLTWFIKGGRNLKSGISHQSTDHVGRRGVEGPAEGGYESSAVGRALQTAGGDFRTRERRLSECQCIAQVHGCCFV